MIEVNPRHRRFYEAMLRFKCVEPPRSNPTVDAPAQLMWLNVAAIRRNIDRQAGQDANTARSLYPYFFSPKEEAGIYGRLAAHIPELAQGLGIDEVRSPKQGMSLA